MEKKGDTGGSEISVDRNTSIYGWAARMRKNGAKSEKKGAKTPSGYA